VIRLFVTVTILVCGGVTQAASCPLVIAHRGASGDRPEHTLAAYTLAIEQGADFIEPDLVPTKDGVLIARHENALAIVALDDAGQIKTTDGKPVVLEATTDVASHPEFADRLAVKRIDGTPVGGWFSEDFTAAEVRTLRARERVPQIRPANTAFNDRFEIPTFAEVLALARSTGVGVYPELKHYTYFMNEATGIDGQPVRHDTVNLLLRDLLRADFDDPKRIFIQSFEVAPLVRLHGIAAAGDAPAWPLVQLVGMPDLVPYDLQMNKEPTTYGQLLSDPAGLKARYADAVGPAFQMVMAAPDLIPRLHEAGLKVHPWTLRNEMQFLPEGVSFAALLRRLVDAGVDGIFTDHPAMMRAALGDCSLF
jgi:glycerophosphoryl diester phosphodiesterase